MQAVGGACTIQPRVLVGYFLSRPFEDHVVSGETPPISPAARRLVGRSLVDLPPSCFELHDSLHLESQMPEQANGRADDEEAVYRAELPLQRPLLRQHDVDESGAWALDPRDLADASLAVRSQALSHFSWVVVSDSDGGIQSERWRTSKSHTQACFPAGAVHERWPTRGTEQMHDADRDDLSACDRLMVPPGPSHHSTCTAGYSTEALC